ncbi:E3 ubiquitin-protein ligase RGLG2-like [Alnus glutinosa]|uniref:E3 ubiquitin-protein ligase RGLG2-like n=1 Tax=Alnus glutinosa TaxID=3517 RepID=UPI002D77556D|nr:E3 ubiquitin-protein ligase RGLG2-like [Alnus glutinosa]XP_062160438.1 E3 ubiquitin-protein ligase RGLG2-like [Alnus glutinosa]XP_062160439.1 E3 ubiquitin-protein ligase RGLG2-like [Alnus glutinosa]XP_062160441.1 E3 ubiquitin-protein ligase RGLG2-like [Alnus glutinosa]
MGGKPSRDQSQRYRYNHNGSSASPSNLGSSSYSYSRNYADYDRRSKLQSRYQIIGDNYHSLEQVTQALHQAGLESSNLIVGIDFTKSNEWTGARSFHRRSLHHLGDSPNPYEQAISIIGRTLSAFDEDNLIPCYGFGDATTHDQEVFSFFDSRQCNGFEEVLSRYREIVPHVHLSGPTSFAPIIETAIEIVDNSVGQYHVLMIIADGQVMARSPQEQSTLNAIVKASEYPLSIVLVGVGDGPWDMMHQFDDNIPFRAFDNFQFVNFTEIMSKHIPASQKEAEFALAALMEIPSQYKATTELQLLGYQRGTSGKLPLPPPVGNTSASSYPKHMRPSSNEHSNRYTWSSSNEQGSGFHYASSPYTEHSSQNRSCPVCLWNQKDLALGCGHQTCCDCGRDLTFCPICRAHITTRIKLYE